MPSMRSISNHATTGGIVDVHHFLNIFMLGIASITCKQQVPYKSSGLTHCPACTLAYLDISTQALLLRGGQDEEVRRTAM